MLRGKTVCSRYRLVNVKIIWNILRVWTQLISLLLFAHDEQRTQTL